MISIVVPVFNEKEVLESFNTQVIDSTKLFEEDFEIIYVNEDFNKPD